MPTTRRKFLYTAGAIGAAALAADTIWREPNHPVLVRRDIKFRRWPEHLEGFTIAFLSDFHYDATFSIHPITTAINIVNSLNADLVVLTGDFVSMPMLSFNGKSAARNAEPCAKLLGQLRARHGLWAVMGNHDYYTDSDHVTAVLRSEGINVLANESAAIEQNGARFWLSGVNDVLSGTANLERTLERVPHDEATILLAHEPDFANEASRYPIDLQLSGHSHGGQVRFPLVGPLYLPDLAKQYVLGQYQIGSLTLYTNPGIGTVGLPVRLNCPPEITLLRITKS